MEKDAAPAAEQSRIERRGEEKRGTLTVVRGLHLPGAVVRLISHGERQEGRRRTGILERGVVAAVLASCGTGDCSDEARVTRDLP